jgi:hypothetical protein
VDLADHGHVTAGVQDDLRLSAEGFGVRDPPQRHRPQPNRLPAAPRRRFEDRLPHQEALLVVLELAVDRVPLPPAQPLGQFALEFPLDPFASFGPVGPDRFWVDLGHGQWWRRIVRNDENVIQPFRTMLCEECPV